ncbi:sensor histidine kinase [Mucilaginibacter sp. BT774]|uniref:sensor histidine kinase n=1 Tax=Mucilaginibacter sp. BT774 TaxID=3062276 RepID=UPI002675F3D9|nr:ATP-binding protein [Mucilaginibacter sp. BT774]MDO3627584.1 ATP-binding protein [Mucilaginibacter sp. BT774]
MQSQIEVQEATMSMLGQELHDNICQQISSIKLLPAIVRSNPARAEQTLEEMEQYLGETINDIRNLTKAMDKEWLEQFDLVANLETEIKRINAANRLTIRMETPKALPLEADKQLMLFRIVQEALQNAVRHSGASEIGIAVSTGTTGIDLSIMDNGKGFKNNLKSEGLGIRNMKHRTSLLKGTIEWTSNDSGSAVRISIPLTDTAHEN